MKYDHILIVGFGGPEKMADVRPFLQEVTRGIPIPEERLKEVEHHYELIGGASPYNKYAYQILEALKKNLAEQGISLPVLIGMKNWHPFLKDAMAEVKAKGYKKGIGIILATQRSDASFEKYLRAVEEAKKETAVSAEYQYLPAWFEHPLYIKAQAAQVEKVLKGKKDLTLLFTAHSIPSEMAAKSRYAQEFEKGAELVAKKLGFSSWETAYQSRSGSPRQPWLEPDVLQKIKELASRKVKTVCLIPIGFVTDNVEVLYDLDIEAKQEAEKLGMTYLRASAVMDHPKFIQMLVESVKKVSGEVKCSIG